MEESSCLKKRNKVFKLVFETMHDRFFRLKFNLHTKKSIIIVLKQQL